MAHSFDNNPSTGGINVDQEVRELPSSDYQYAINFRNGAPYEGLGGVSTNVKGNTLIELYECPYTGYASLPTGDNKTIGYFEDNLNDTVIYCVWNSLGKHGIYRHYPQKTSDTNPLGIVEQVMQFDFGWSQDERITSFELLPSTTGDLFYWTDSWGLRVINLNRANIVNKQKSWNIYFAKTNPFTGAGTFELLLQDFNSAVVVAIAINVAAFTDAKLAITYIVDQINSNYGSSVTAINRGCYIEITEVKTNSFSYSVSGYPMQIVPENWYGILLEEFMFARAKCPSMFAPQLEYKQDLNYSYNNVKNHVFQAALQFFYNDFEFSVLSVASQLPINNLQCDGTDNQSLNYIDIDFANADILAQLAPYLVMIKKVGVIVREGNTGTWKTFDTITPCDFLDFVNGAYVLHYGFYNDTQATPVDSITVLQLDSGVPIYSDSQNTMFNRIIDGGITQGRDAPVNVQAKCQMEFGGQPNPKLYKVRFRVRILTYGLGDGAVAGAESFQGLFPNLHKYPFWEPGTTGASTPYTLCRGGIFHDTLRTTNNFPFFGGGGFGTGPGGDFGIRSGMEDALDQRIPETGFVIYCAGTPYFGITKQINVGLPTDPNGALDTSTPQRIVDIGNYLYNGGDLYSEVEMLLPAGEYVARMGSHWDAFGDPIGKGFAYDLSGGTFYQRTSTNVCGIFSNDFSAWYKKKEWKFTVTNADIPDAATFVVTDLAPPWDVALGIWNPLNCYLYDDSDGTFANSDPNSATFEGISVEKAIVRYSPLAAPTSFTWDNVACTDHNGYWFGMADEGQEYVAGEINGVTLVATITMYVGSLTDLFNKTLTPIPFGTSSPTPPDPYGDGLRFGIIATDNANGRSNCSTKISGLVKDINGNAVTEVLIIYETGRVDKTGQDGSYEMVAWGDMITPNLPNFPTLFSPITNGTNRVVDNLIFELSLFCIPDYPNGQEYSPVNIDPIGNNGTTTPPPYSPTAVYPVPVFIINEGNNPSIKAHKRGGNYRYVGRCYDAYGRYCSCFFLFQVYVPFITEDLGTYQLQDFNGNVYAIGTYAYGKPSLKWVLDPSTLFPDYVAYFQLMRTKNGIYGRYVQWVANQVTYLSALPNPSASVPEIQTSFQNADAIAVKLDISNMLAYDVTNPGATIGYNYQDGDRIRLIANRSLVNYSTGNFPQVGNITDFEIIKDQTLGISGVVYINPNNFSLELQSGMLFEIYNPHTLETADTEIFYEVGEVVKVNNGVPEKYSGVFTNGDTYWRGRLIIVNDNATKFASAYPVVIEDASVSDFYKSDSNDINPTRIGTIDKNLRQIYYRDRMIVSDTFQEGSALNGLSLCLPTNTTDLGSQFGSVARLIVIGKLLHAIMKNTNLSSTVGVVSLQYAQATTTVEAISSEFLGTQYPSRQNIGTDHPATVTNIDGYIYGMFELRKNVWRHAEDGSDEISRNNYMDDKNQPRTRMMTYFKRLCEGGIWDAVSIYDKRYKEYILTVWKTKSIPGTITNSYVDVSVDDNTLTAANIGDLITITYIDALTGQTLTGRTTITDVKAHGDRAFVYYDTTGFNVKTGFAVTLRYRGEGSTIAWNEFSNSWKTEYPFVPECYASLGDNIYAFQNGKIWRQDSNAIRNNFFGVQYKMKLKAVFNDQADFMKVWNSCILESKQDNGGNDWEATIITNDNGQQSRLPKGIWKKIREKWFAPFMRNELDLTKPPLARLSQGAPLVSSTLTVLLENDYTGEVRLRHWSSNFTLNERTSK